MNSHSLPGEPAGRIVVFQERSIRRTWHNEEWWFAVVDIVAVLTDSVHPEGYVKDLRRRDKELAKGWGQIATPLRADKGSASIPFCDDAGDTGVGDVRGGGAD